VLVTEMPDNVSAAAIALAFAAAVPCALARPTALMSNAEGLERCAKPRLAAISQSLRALPLLAVDSPGHPHLSCAPRDKPPAIQQAWVCADS